VGGRSYRAVVDCDKAIKEMMEAEWGSAPLTRMVWEVLGQKVTGGKGQERDRTRIS